MVRKILRCLPKNKWGPKVTAIEEAQDLKKLELDDLMGKLLIHDIHLKEDEVESSKKGIALKVAQEDSTSEEEETNDNDEEASSLIDNTNISSCYGCGMPGHLVEGLSNHPKNG